MSSGNLYGGIETMLVTIARNRHACPQMEQQFAMCFDGRVTEELRDTGAVVHMLGAVRLSRPRSVWRARSALRSVQRKIRFDVVICHGPWPLAVFGPAVRRDGIALVMWAHGTYAGRNWLERWARLHLPDLVIANSQYTCGHAARYMPGVARIAILCPVEVSPAKFEPHQRSMVRKAFDTPEEAVVIVQVSRMEAWKGQRVLLTALARLGENPAWCCWIVGGAQRASEQRYLRELRNLAADCGIAERVRFLGARTDVPQVLAAADIHCQPNTGAEPFGITFIEAMGASLPVVTSAIGGPLEIVNETCGRLVPPENVGSLAAAIDELLASVAVRKQLGAAGLARSRVLCDPRARLTDLDVALRRLVDGVKEPDKRMSAAGRAGTAA